MVSRPKRPRDPFQLAKLIGDISTGQVEDSNPDAGKDPAAIAIRHLRATFEQENLALKDYLVSSKKGRAPTVWKVK